MIDRRAGAIYECDLEEEKLDAGRPHFDRFYISHTRMWAGPHSGACESGADDAG